jgi:hypothetical protein
MKKFDKNNFKKLALLGIASGTAIMTQGAVQAADASAASNMLAFGHCSGRSGCGGFAYRNVPSQDSYYYSGGDASTYYAPSGCQAYSQPSSGCNAQQWQQPQYQGQPQYQYQGQPSSGCHAQQWQQPQYQGQPQYQYQIQQTPSSGCGAAPSTQGMSQPAQQMPQEQSSIISRWETSGYTADNAKENNGYGQGQQGSATTQKMTESELLSQLNEQGKATYQRLDAAGKALALKLANQSCKGQNECKGLNSCKNNEHSCAGKGSCAGTADANYKDKNLAVKVAAMKMAEKRANAASPAK